MNKTVIVWNEGNNDFNSEFPHKTSHPEEISYAHAAYNLLMQGVKLSVGDSIAMDVNGNAIMPRKIKSITWVFKRVKGSGSNEEYMDKAYINIVLYNE